MSKKIDEFRNFIKQYPLLIKEVEDKKTTWQSLYEDWVILGENDSKWESYKKEKENTTSSKSNTLEELLSSTSIKNVINYVKKIDPDSISKTLNTVQKVLQITQSFNTRPTGIYNNNYNSWWD